MLHERFYCDHKKSLRKADILFHLTISLKFWFKVLSFFFFCFLWWCPRKVVVLLFRQIFVKYFQLQLSFFNNRIYKTTNHAIRCNCTRNNSPRQIITFNQNVVFFGKIYFVKMKFSLKQFSKFCYNLFFSHVQMTWYFFHNINFFYGSKHSVIWWLFVLKFENSFKHFLTKSSF